MLDLFSIYIGLFEKLFQLILGESRFRISLGPLSVELGKDPDKSYSKILQKLDTAKRHMADAITAVDALKEQYGQENDRLDQLIVAVETKKHEYELAKNNLETTREYLERDQTALRSALGINDRRSKLVGFVTGIITSLIASLLWLVTPYVFKWVKALVS